MGAFVCSDFFRLTSRTSRNFEDLKYLSEEDQKLTAARVPFFVRIGLSYSPEIGQ
jgi:hypothetical protein